MEETVGILIFVITDGLTYELKEAKSHPGI